MMKQSITKILFTILISMMGANALAYDIEVKNADGLTIYYNFINGGKELEVAKAVYSGNVVIPEDVTYMNITRKVTSIGNEAFYDCYSLMSVVIPNSVKSIGQKAFFECYSLTSLTIGNNVKSIGTYSFYSCSGLTSLTIPNSVSYIGEGAFYSCSGLTSLTIPNSVTEIGNHAFGACSGLTSMSIPNSVTEIGDGVFAGCTGLTSLTIPNSVTSIGKEAFNWCSGLTSLTIPNSVTYIGEGAFVWCSGLTSLTIPNSVTYIGRNAFSNCKGLISVTIGASVTSIGYEVFAYVDIPTIISLIENPFDISNNTFSTNTFKNATLYVPVGTLEKYKIKKGWKDFLYIVEGTGPNGSGGDTPETKKCATPTIGYQNGKLSFYCETEGASCQYMITDDDIKSGSANEIQLGVTYRISVYATKSGYDNSETATATLCWIDVEPKTEGITNSVANVRAQPVMIQNNGSTLTISGVDEDTPIYVYDTAGKLVGSAQASIGTTSIYTSLNKGQMGVVKIGEKSVKVIIK